MSRSIAILTILISGFALSASAELGPVALDQALRDLRCDLRLMCVAAHPDDEDGATLAYYRKRFGVETHAVIATRGEGGQNEIGPELYEELGVIRTKEMMAAAEITGAQLHFLDLPEFGYSKSIEETYEIWGKEETLRRCVAMIRKVRPHVIITHHGRRNDHGHHQAIGDALIEAFDVAADASAFPEAGQPWQALRLYIREWQNPGDAAVVPIGELDPVRGKTYAEIAAEALEAHHSQGMGMFANRFITGNPAVYYTIEKEHFPPYDGPAHSEADAGALFAGLPKPNAGFLGVSPLSERARAALEALPQPGDAVERTEIGPWVSALHQVRIEQAVASNEGTEAGVARAYMYRKFHERIGQAIQCALSLDYSVAVSDDVVVPGQTVRLSKTFHNFNQVDFGRRGQFGRWEMFQDSLVTANLSSIPTETTDWQEAFSVPLDARLTIPEAKYLFKAGAGHYQWQSRLTLLSVKQFDWYIELEAPLRIEVAPLTGIAYPAGPFLLRVGAGGGVEAGALLTNYAPEGRKISPEVSLPEGWRAEPIGDIDFAEEDEQRYLALQLTPPADAPPGDYPVTLSADDGSPAESTLIRVVDVAVPPSKKVGVIESYDDTFVKTLARLEVPHATLGIEDFNAERLDTFTAIIVDIRAYAKREDLVANNAALLEYVRRGGTLLVQYQKTFEWEARFAPYPITLSRNRVTRENAPVTLLAPKHPLFTTPNPIGTRDWEGWRQERGLYFPSAWDDAYTPLVACADPGEDIPPGSLLIAPYGQGTYLYTALGWYRQLRDLHPGALRVFANMLAL